VIGRNQKVSQVASISQRASTEPRLPVRQLISLYSKQQLRFLGIITPHPQRTIFLFGFLALLCYGMLITTVTNFLQQPQPQLPMILVVAGVLGPGIMLAGVISLNLEAKSDYRELEALRALPIKPGQIAGLRFIIALLLAFFFALFLLLPVSLAVVAHYGFNLHVSGQALLSVILLPILPAALGQYLNLRLVGANWSKFIGAGLPLGILITSIAPSVSSEYIPWLRVLAVPALALIGQLHWWEFGFLALLWLGASGWLLKITLEIITSVNYRVQSDQIRPGENKVVHAALTRPTVGRLSLLARLSLNRLKLAAPTLLALPIFLGSYSWLGILKQSQEPGVVLPVLLASCVGIVTLSLGLLMRNALGGGRELRALDVLPLSPRQILLGSWVVVLGYVLVLTGLIGFLAGLGLDEKDGWLIGPFLFSTALGLGSLQLAGMLAANSFGRWLLWVGLPLLGYSSLKLGLMTFVVALQLLPQGVYDWVVALIVGLVFDCILAGVYWWKILPGLYYRYVDRQRY
jgi:hypothetical protein